MFVFFFSFSCTKHDRGTVEAPTKAGYDFYTLTSINRVLSLPKSVLVPFYPGWWVRCRQRQGGDRILVGRRCCTGCIIS